MSAAKAPNDSGPPYTIRGSVTSVHMSPPAAVREFVNGRSVRARSRPMEQLITAKYGQSRIDGDAL